MTGPGINQPIVGKYLRDETVFGKTGAVMGGSAGAVRDDSARESRTSVIERSVPLTKTQAEKAAKYIADARGNPGEYQLFSKNCIDLVQGALDASGADTRIDKIFTEQELDDLGDIPYGAGDEVQRRGLIIDVDKDVKTFRDSENAPFGPHAEGDGAPDASPLELSQSDGGLELGADVEQRAETSDTYPESVRAAAMAIVADDNKDNGTAELEADLDDLMLKNVDDLTEREIKILGGWSWKLPSNDPKRLEIEDRRRDFYRLNYGDQPSKTDETGRLVAPEPVRSVPVKPKGLAMPDGAPVAGALKRVADKLARPVADDGEANVVKALQTGLSLLGEPLKVDGVSGSKTKAALKRTVAKRGAGGAEEAFGIGRFKRFAETERSTGGSASGLRETIEKDVQPLFASHRPNIAAEALQESLNDLSAKAAAEHRQPAPEPLTVDGIIGSKTTDAFRSALVETGPKKLATSYASMLGFVD
ncbi:MAG: hypothetical protein JJ900_11715 [Rhodospirillales bacterium]|nr:hypothetical protein [Rhodospirillales bacterium]